MHPNVPAPRDGNVRHFVDDDTIDIAVNRHVGDHLPAERFDTAGTDIHDATASDVDDDDDGVNLHKGATDAPSGADWPDTAAAPTTAASTADDSTAAADSPSIDEPTTVDAVDTVPDHTPDNTPDYAPDDAAEQSPGEASAPDATPWTTGTDAQSMRERWFQAQLSFIDDPQASAEAVRDILDEAIAAHTASLIEQRDRLDTWRNGQSSDTEVLRCAIRGYRDLLRAVLGE